MYSEIINCLRLSSFPNKFIFVSKDVTSDVNFVFCELLSHYVNKHFTVILLNFEQSYAHYNHMLLKSGVNMRLLKENQQIITIDCLSEIEKLTNIEALDVNQNAAFKDLFDSEKVVSVKTLCYLIKKTVQKLIDESKQFIIFIDDINSLLNLGIKVTCILSFVQYCRSLCFEDAQNLMLIGSVYAKEDLMNKKLVEYLFHVADIKIQVEGLKTGYSKDIHGKVCTILIFLNMIMFIIY